MNQYLLIRSSQPQNVFGLFTQEILISEGLTGFQTVDLDRDALPSLDPNDLVVLTRCPVKKAECEALYNAVERGTRLVAFQPSLSLASAFGLVSALKVLHPGWIRVRDGHPGAGVPLQTHIPIALHEASDWVVLADAVETNWTESGYPAVVTRTIGRGRVAFFLYDLAHAVARIRFGNPDLASFCTTGVWRWLHAVDLFSGHIDERVQDVPQADLHTQLLAWVLTDLSSVPLLRVWYYPEIRNRSVAVMQSDDDGSTVAQFRELSDSLVAHQGTATFYLMRDTHMSEADVAEFRALGHTFAPHANPFNSQEDWCFGFPDVLREETRMFRERFGECSRSIQCHCAPWKGYMDWVPLFMELGYRLLFAYLSAPIALLGGFMCGSGRPIRFYALDGTQHHCWQQPILYYDDTTVRDLIQQQGLDDLLARFRSLVDRTVKQTHTAIGILSHPVSFATYSKPLMQPAFDLLRQQNVPILNGDQWLEFLERRSGVVATLEDCTDHRCVYRLSDVRGRISLMVPRKSASCEIAVNGIAAEPVMERRLEQDYFLFEVEGNGQPLSVCVHRKE